ncbi:hypothetical protein CHGG_07326 [Chaetomium globosum CBS 148.51]|uniref:Uncharacterized protein n=1 Tax=Chaetomium globosum (strain ATCC 6205 / CBS 148.51 / DSM 1962 / NBRC 6347 / NRRL 1970) TaxID=306901 RepID=Q2GXH8_CHAGB|nr:uncharacterized protein CHGG_07326 [Chaetomium globosum CBS 148.51]EAQ86073.1 hypothetical protein CHGG_07326 [Chaetomium globosum CBS 148.51]
MSPPTQDEPQPVDPQTPQRNSTAKYANAATPTNKRASAPIAATPKSAPAAAGNASANKKKVEPSLLGDFFLGRQSPARVVAQREAMKQRRKSMAADAANVREELRQEMRAAAVRRIQQPGGVTDRVKAWQKGNAAAMKQQGGVMPEPDDLASVPTEVGAHVPAESVTESDRLRIRMRQKSKKKKPNSDKAEDKENQDAVASDETEREKPTLATSGTSASKPPVVVKLAPKKRIIGPRRVEIPEPPPPPKVKQYRHRKSGATLTVEEDAPSVIASDPGIRPTQKPPVDDGIRVNPVRMKPGKPKPDTEDGIRIPPVRKKEPLDDGIRVRPIETKLPDDGIRVRPIDSPLTADGIRVRPGPDVSADDTPVRPASSGPTPAARSSKAPSAQRAPSPGSDDVIEVIEDPETEVETPTKKKAPRRRRSKRRNRSPNLRTVEPPEDRPSESETARQIPSPVGSDGESDLVPPTVLGNKSLADIPFGYSAFSELDLPLGADARNSTVKRPKAQQRNPSFKAMPKVFKKVVTGAKDIIQEMAEPPRPVATNKPQSIESWLNGTVDPFVEPSASSPVSQEPTHKEPAPKEPARKEPVPQDSSHKAPAPQEAARKASVSQESARKAPVSKEPTRNVPAPKEPTRNVPAPKEPTRSAPALKEPTRNALAEDRKPTPESPGAALESHKRSTSRPSSRPPSRQASEDRSRETADSTLTKSSGSQDNTESQREEDSDATPKKAKSPPASSAGLKRRRATRGAAPPAKTGGKKPFRELLKEAFRGESAGHKLPPTVYPSCETDDESDHEGDDYESTIRSKGPAASDYSSGYYSSTYDSMLSSDLSSQEAQRRKPPTTGVHELSTIVSEEVGSTISSDAHSDVSHTTVTQTTAFTKSTDISRQKSQKSGLKRRLTKHSDFVSVLSLPDNGQLVAPRRSKSIKSSHSLHRRPSRANKSRTDELLDEFADDEHFYGRELKALVDGVVPVLLRDVMNGGVGEAKADATVKSVVGMGMALEKLRNFHKQVPLDDISELLFWLEDVSPVYDSYLDVWRLGFQGLIINLAPRNGMFDDEDSLLNALPLNEDGDVVGENGERVDVAFLLKRPLIRVKWMVKFLKAAVAITETRDAERLLSVFTALQEKARKRHREETARMMDEDANNTDTSRCRDLRNLLSLDGIIMNRTRQVAALDVFSLDLEHSSGQRLGCQVEMIFRDSPALPEDKGDILIRELGNNTRSWLLFPPVPRQYISARLGDDDDSLIVMIRGSHNGNDWYELLKISTNSEEQIDYWLRVLGSHPMPPLTRSRPASMVLGSTSPKTGATDVPVGERKVSVSSLGSSDTERPTTPSRHRRGQHGGSAPPAATGYAYPDMAAKENYTLDRPEQSTRRSSWDHSSADVPKIVKAPPNTTPYREDGAPPPPIHRNLSSKSTGLLAPPVESRRRTRLKRRMSSPLKHEYTPSDVSSDSSCTASDDESDSSETSGGDDLDEDEVPDTIPGYSIKEPEVAPAASVISDNSVTPSHSASQMELAVGNDSRPERPVTKYVGTVSYWSARKGIWKDVNDGQPASIVIHPGCMEVHPLSEQHSNRQAYPLQSSGTSEVDNSNKDAGTIVPLITLILTPVVMIRRSTALDLEVRSPASPEARLKIEASMFRFRTVNQADARDLYESVHNSRLNNARYIQLSEEARFQSFGQMQPVPGDGSAGDEGSSQRRSWFGRKNSYRASTRAPSVSQGSISTTISATSFLRRLMGGGNNNSYNIDESTLDKPRPHSAAAASGGGSLYTSGSGSGGSGSGSITPPRSASISLSNSGSQSRWSSGFAKPFSPDQPLEIRCHLNVQNNRWLDKGDCVLHISRPPPGVRQELPLYNGLEKRVIVTHATKKNADRPLILLDAVLGSKCFSLLGSKGVMCSVWENLRDEEGNVGVAPRNGAIAGKVTKWCFQCKSMQQAGWIMQLLTTEVPGLMMG